MHLVTGCGENLSWCDDIGATILNCWYQVAVEQKVVRNIFLLVIKSDKLVHIHHSLRWDIKSHQWAAVIIQVIASGDSLID